MSQYCTKSASEDAFPMRIIKDFSSIEYPPNFSGPKLTNAATKKISYDSAFLMQFQQLCLETNVDLSCFFGTTRELYHIHNNTILSDISSHFADSEHNQRISRESAGSSGASSILENITDDHHSIYQDCLHDIVYKKVKSPFNIQPPYYTGIFQLNENSEFVATTTDDQHSIVIECSQFTPYYLNQKSLASCLRDQYPTATGIRFKTASKPEKMYVIISFDHHALCTQALQNKFTLRGKIIHVSKTLPKSSEVVHVDISRIPIPCTNRVRDCLIKVFSEYGDILEMGKYVSEEGHWFSGFGYVTLNVDKTKNYDKQLITRDIVFGAGLLLHVVSCKVVKLECPVCQKEYKRHPIQNRPSSCPHY